jgi:flagellar biosynthesis protein FlhF
MQVKRYRAETIREAIARVRDILGPEAMILSTKKVKGKNRGGMFEISAVPAGEDIPPAQASPLGKVTEELTSIKEMIYLMNHFGSPIEKLVMNPPLLNLYAKLIKSGVNDHYARMFLENAGALQGNAPGQGESLREKTLKELKKKITVRDPFRRTNKNQIVAAFIGTTGVGKTTTVAKIGAQLMLKAHRKVGLISIDNYRIGGMEQLKTYANILGIPCFPAFNRKDLAFALKRMEQRDVVLIDTAGQSQYDRARMEELKKMMTDDLAITSHLLLSVATTESEMDQTAINFSPLKFQSYIFTKTDEAERCGCIINQIMKLPLPISYITTGQNVPEDIERASKENIVNLILDKK